MTGRQVLIITAALCLLSVGGLKTGGAPEVAALVGRHGPNQERLVVPVATASWDEVFPGGLYRPNSMSASASGLICLTDNGDKRVLVFDEDLRMRLEIGAEGDGPGEFRQPASCAISANDGVFVFDTLHRRLSEFDRSGGLIGTYQMQVPGRSPTVLQSGEVMAVGRDFRTITVHAPNGGTPRTIELPPMSCAGTDIGMADVTGAISPDGRYAAFARDSPCQESDHSLVARIDLDSPAAETFPLIVYDDFRVERPFMRQARGVQRKLVLRRPAAYGTRAYFLHAYTKRVDGVLLTPLDVWDENLAEPVRLFVANPQAERTRLWLMTATASGDLLIIDTVSETILRLAAADLLAATGQ